MIDAAILARLRSQTEQAGLILFTGAGFSCDARDRSGRRLPSVDDLKRELWALSFPQQGFDASSSLGDLFEVALRAHARQLNDLLQSRFRVDPNSLPDYYKSYLDFPWLRIYTLNVDDLGEAASRRFPLRREILALSATSAPGMDAPTSRRGGRQVEFVHLNGVVTEGGPERLTFSDTQYAERIANREPWYSRCVSDLESRPLIFIGTELNEIPLWQHIELRRRRVSHGRDLRPTSILVTPSLNAARRAKLRELKIEWLTGTAEWFAREVLTQLQDQATRGFVFLDGYSEAAARTRLPLVSELVAERPKIDTNYLLGDEPIWADLIQQRAIERTSDADLLDTALGIVNGDTTEAALAITGTAGTGKSTALMSLALALTNRGIPVLWIDRESDVAPVTVRKRVVEAEMPFVLAIDDADLYGAQLVGLIQDLVPGRRGLLFMVAVRSGKIDEVSRPLERNQRVRLIEKVVPFLSDDDIEKLVAVLDKHNRLGRLKGMSSVERKAVFSRYAGRQLLVAMIEATSNERFEEKAERELTELSGSMRQLYGLISIATSLRQFLLKDEILLASGDRAADALEALDRLVARHLVICPPPSYRYRSRHRVIADLVTEKLRLLGELEDAFAGLLFAMATKVNPSMDRGSRPWRFLIRLMNHQLVLRLLGARSGRRIYEEVEGLLAYDYHYWLQRGSVEVEAGDLRLAENFLNQARSLAPDDYRVETEYSYMLMKKALERPVEAHSHELVASALEILEGAIEARGSADPHPFHVLGTQGLAWAETALMSRSEKRRFLDRLLAPLRKGEEMHPSEVQLRRLREDVHAASLRTVISPGSGQ